jgi:tetratricopeptide (TPR) repeat protein
VVGGGVGLSLLLLAGILRVYFLKPEWLSPVLVTMDWQSPVPNLADAYYNRGIAYAAKGEYDREIADYNQALQLNSNLAEAYYNRGLAYGAKGDKQKAIADFQTCLKLAQTPQFKQAVQQQLAELGVK